VRANELPPQRATIATKRKSILLWNLRQDETKLKQRVKEVKEQIAQGAKYYEYRTELLMCLGCREN
jgi:hypothetical protein